MGNQYKHLPEMFPLGQVIARLSCDSIDYNFCAQWYYWNEGWLTCYRIFCASMLWILPFKHYSTEYLIPDCCISEFLYTLYLGVDACHILSLFQLQNLTSGFNAVLCGESSLTFIWKPKRNLCLCDWIDTKPEFLV